MPSSSKAIPLGSVVMFSSLSRTTLSTEYLPRYPDNMAPVGPQPQMMTSVDSHSADMVIMVFDYFVDTFPPQATMVSAALPDSDRLLLREVSGYAACGRSHFLCSFPHFACRPGICEQWPAPQTRLTMLASAGTWELGGLPIGHIPRQIMYCLNRRSILYPYPIEVPVYQDSSPCMDTFSLPLTRF